MKETLFDTYLDDYLMHQMVTTAFSDEETCGFLGVLYYNPTPEISPDDFGPEPPTDDDEDTRPSQLPKEWR